MLLVALASGRDVAVPDEMRSGFAVLGSSSARDADAGASPDGAGENNP